MPCGLIQSAAAAGQHDEGRSHAFDMTRMVYGGFKVDCGRIRRGGFREAQAHPRNPRPLPQLYNFTVNRDALGPHLVLCFLVGIADNGHRTADFELVL